MMGVIGKSQSLLLSARMHRYSQGVETPDESTDARQQSAGRALASPLRLRILRFCLYESRTNREIAEEFGLNPGTSLHHVRTLVENDFLAPDEPRAGRRGAREIPYRATGLSWSTRIEGQGSLMVRTFLDEIDGLNLDDEFMVRMGFKLSPERRDELQHKLVDLILEYHHSPDEDGELSGLFLSVHPERRQSEPTNPGSA